jgi:RNA polymerase sigma-70 factor (ECF subfamily)
MSENRDLRSLLTDAMAGNAQAVEDLLASLRPYLHLLVRRQLGGSPADLGDSDLVQETLMRIHRGVGRGQRDTPAHFQGQDMPQFLGWIGQIARHVVADSLRHDQAEKRSAGREVRGDAVFAQLAQATSPAARLERGERALHLAAALERLPEHQRQVLQWRFFDQLSFAEISQRTGKSVGALRVVCTRALERLANDETLRREMGGQP